MGIFRLHVKRNGIEQDKELVFRDFKERDKFLKEELHKTRFKRLQYNYKEGEYLRVYRGNVTFIEYDIVKFKREYDRVLTPQAQAYDQKLDAKLQAQKLFSPKALTF